MQVYLGMIGRHRQSFYDGAILQQIKVQDWHDTKSDMFFKEHSHSLWEDRMTLERSKAPGPDSPAPVEYNVRHIKDTLTSTIRVSKTKFFFSTNPCESTK